MTTTLKIKESINKVLEEKFEEIEVYSSDVSEGFDRPALFTRIIPIAMEYESINYISHKQMIVINYFSEKETEVENMEMNDKLIKAFGMTLQVGQRHFLCKNIRSEIINSVLQFRFDLDYLTHIAKEETHETITEVEVEFEKE